MANISILPRPIDRIGSCIREGYERAKRGGEEWIEGSLIVAANLRAAKQLFQSNSAFSRWLKDSGNSFYQKDDRAALVAMGADIELLRDILETSKSNSYQLIYRENKKRFRNATNTDQAPDTARRKSGSEGKRAMLLTVRREKLGSEIVTRITNTSLDGTREMGALIALSDASPGRAEALITRAENGEPVSAEAELLKLKKKPPVTCERPNKAWKHSRMLALFLQAPRDVQIEWLESVREQITNPILTVVNELKN